MSYIASALAVELLVSVLQHPDKGLAPADTSANDDHLTVEHISPLGIVPHQVGDKLIIKLFRAHVSYMKWEIYEKVILKKKSADDNKNMKNYPAWK